MSSHEELNKRINAVSESFKQIIQIIPPRGKDEPAPYWLHSELLERYKIVSKIDIQTGMNVLEIGCGPHALTSIVLAHLVKPNGRVVAIDRSRWTFVQELLTTTDLKQYIIPIALDATNLPIPYKSFDLSVIVHGIRNMGDNTTLITILKEMLRVSSRIVIAESLPIAKTEAQKAHIEMYNLREEIFEAISGRKDDRHYRPLSGLVELVKLAGGKNIKSEVVDLDMPHYLATLPRQYLEQIPDKTKRAELLERWLISHQKIDKHGEEHPTVGIVQATS
ncbi:MAG: class I SAM-dependent methyltransferase [Candidatus Heimdallarchaeaceae archaeon]